MKFKNKFIYIFIASFLVITGIIGCASPQTGTRTEQFTVTRGDITDAVNADGSLSLPTQRALSFGVDGKIANITVAEGDSVTGGQVLATLDSSSLEIALKNADLAIEVAEADRNAAEAGVQTAQAALKQAQNGILSAEADQAQAENGVKTAEANLAQATTGVQSAQNDLDSASTALLKISYPYTFTTFNLNIPAAVSAVHDAQLDLNLAKTQLAAAAPGSPEYAGALDKLNTALDSLATAQENLVVGTNIDNFLAMYQQSQAGVSTTQTAYAISDYWTIKSAQLGVNKAQLGVDASKQALDIAQLAVASANNNVAKAKLGVEAAKLMADQAQASVLSAQAALSKAEAAAEKASYDRQTAADMLSKATITAPFDGIIAEVDAKTGDVLTTVDYSRTIFQIIDPSHMEFMIKVDELDILGVKIGQAADVSIDAVPGLSITGKVLFVSPLPTTESGVVQYPVKIGFDVPAGVALQSGMSSSADIIISQHQNTLILPSRAIGTNNSGKPVVKQLVNGQVQEKEVVTGISTSLETEIISGLNEGDIVVVGVPAQ